LIVDIPGEAATRQALEVQGFHVDDIEPLHQIVRELEGVITAHVRTRSWSRATSKLAWRRRCDPWTQRETRR